MLSRRCTWTILVVVMVLLLQFDAHVADNPLNYPQKDPTYEGGTPDPVTSHGTSKRSVYGCPPDDPYCFWPWNHDNKGRAANIPSNRRYLPTQNRQQSRSSISAVDSIRDRDNFDMLHSQASVIPNVHFFGPQESSPVCNPKDTICPIPFQECVGEGCSNVHFFETQESSPVCNPKDPDCPIPFQECVGEGCSNVHFFETQESSPVCNPKDADCPIPFQECVGEGCLDSNGGDLSSPKINEDVSRFWFPIDLGEKTKKLKGDIKKKMGQFFRQPEEETTNTRLFSSQKLSSRVCNPNDAHCPIPVLECVGEECITSNGGDRYGFQVSENQPQTLRSPPGSPPINPDRYGFKPQTLRFPPGSPPINPDRLSFQPQTLRSFPGSPPINPDGYGFQPQNVRSPPGSPPHFLGAKWQ